MAKKKDEDVQKALQRAIKDYNSGSVHSGSFTSESNSTKSKFSDAVDKQRKSGTPKKETKADTTTNKNASDKKYASELAKYYDEYNETKSEIAQKKAASSSEPRKRSTYTSALDRARKSSLTKNGSAQDFKNRRSEAMGKAAIGSGEDTAELKLMGQINKLKREYQWEEAGRRYDALSAEEKRALYRRTNSSALDRSKMVAENGGLRSRTAMETRTKIGEDIADRYYALENELSDPTKAGEYAFINRVRSAAGEATENVGNWLYDNFGYEPGREVYEKGEARKIGEIASQQFTNEMATNPTKAYQTAVQVSDSIANMLSYKIATGPISLFAGSVASEAAFGKELAKGASYTKAAEVAAEKGSHAANSIFTSGMALGTFGDTYNQNRANGQGKLESTIRATAAGAISYITESLGGIGGSKSPLNKLEEAAKENWFTNILYNAFEEGGEEFAEYTLNYLAQGVIDLAAQGKWNQVYDLKEVWNNAKIGFWSGGMFGLGNTALSGGRQIAAKLDRSSYSGNVEVDAKLDRAESELLDNLMTAYQAQQDPAVMAQIEAQLDAAIPDTIQQASTSPTESVSSEVENVQTEAQTRQEAPAQAEQQAPTQAEQQTEQKAPKKKLSKKEAKQKEMVDQLDVAAREKKKAGKKQTSAQKTIDTVKNSDIPIEQKLQRIKNLYNGSKGAAKEAYKQAYTELLNEKKAAQQSAQNAPAQQAVEAAQEAPAQAEQKVAQRAQSTAEGNNATKVETPKKAAQSGAQLKADRDTVKRAYKDFSNSSMKQSRFEALYNEAYNAESFEAFMKKHPSFGEKLKSAMQKAFENGQRAKDKHSAQAYLDNGMIMQEGDEYYLNNRGDVDTLISKYKEEADSGMYWDEADDGDAVQLRLEDSEIAARREAIKKLEAYRDENFAQKVEQKAEKKAPKQEKTEKKPTDANKKPTSTEKKLENTIKNLENYKKQLENGNMAKLEQKNPDRYSEIMYRLEQMTADENGSDYFGDADEVTVLIDKYKEKLELARAQNGAQTENVGAQVDAPRAQTENVGAQNEASAEKADAQAKNDGAQKSARGIFDENIGTREKPATQEDVDSYVEYALEYGDKKRNAEDAVKQKDSIIYGQASERLVSDMQTLYGVDVEGKTHVLNDNDIRHIDNSHGRGNANEKYPVTAADLKQIPDIVENYDNVYYVKKENGLIGVYYEKRHNGTTYYLEAIGDGNLLYNKQMIKVGTGDIPKIDGLRQEVEKRRAASSPPDGHAPRMYVQDARNNNSSADKIPQSGNNVNPANEYSSEYQNGAEHPETVGAMESDRQNITRAINENGALPQKKKPFSDFDRYKADNNIPSGERAALARKINDPMLGEITVAQNIANLAKDGAKFIEQDGKYYAQNEDGSSVRVSKSAYNYGKWLNDNGVFYTLNQNAEVPKKINGRYVSKSVTTFIVSRGGTDAVVESIVADIERGKEGFTYKRKTHSHDVQYAMDTIREKGFDGAVEFFNEMANGDHKYTVELNTLGIMLSKIASDAYVDSKGKNKDAHELSVQIATWMASNGTNAGQVSESMKIMREIVENSGEMYYERLVESLQEKYKKRLKGKEITLDAELLRKVAETAGTKEYTKWADRLNQSIANQIPSTFGEKVTAWAYFCMLSSGRTHMKNIISNAAMYTMVVQKNLWLSVLEKAYKKKHPEYMLTTSGFKMSKESKKSAKEVLKKADLGTDKYSSEAGFLKDYKTNTMQGNGKLSKLNIPGWVADRLSSITTNALSAEDAVAKKMLFMNRVSQVAEANHWSPEFLNDTANPEAIRAWNTMADIGLKEALEGTFNNSNAIVPVITAYKNMKVTDGVSRVAKAAVGAFIELNARFKNVPANVAASAFKYSPAGLLVNLASDYKLVREGTLDARTALENSAKGMTGTTVSLGAMLLSYLGLLTVGRDADEDKPIDEKEDTTMYLKIPDKKNGDLYIDIDWVDSVAMQFRFGVELKNLLDDIGRATKGEETFDAWGSLVGLCTRSMDTFTNLGMMESLKNLLLNKSGADDASDLLSNSLANFANQLIPRIVTDMRQAFDNEKRNTYYKESTDEYPKWLQIITSVVPQSTVNQFRAAYGNRDELPARLDEWGNPIVEQNPVKRAIESLITPAKTYRANDDKVQKMLDQLDAKVDDNVFPPDYPKFITVNGEKVNLSGKEYEEVARQIGKERYKLLDELRQDREFQKLSADEKAELIQDCYNIANEMAKYGFDDDYSISKVTQDVQDAKKEKISIPKYLRTKQAYDNMSEYEKDGVKYSRAYQLADYLAKDTSTTVKEDIKLIELITRKKEGDSYKSPFENINKVPKVTDKEKMSLYLKLHDDADKEADLQSYMLEYGYKAEEALARYNVAKGSKATYDSLSVKQQAKADKLLAAANKGKTKNKWSKDKIALAASVVTSIGSYGTKKTLNTYIKMLTAMGFTESEAKEFYNYYA